MRRSLHLSVFRQSNSYIRMPTVTDGDSADSDIQMTNDDAGGSSADAGADDAANASTNNGRGPVSGAPPPAPINKMKYNNPVNMIKRERRQSSSRFQLFDLWLVE